jgi:hypothetical protein
MTGPFGVADPLQVVRPHYFGGSLADVLPSALAVLGVPPAAGQPARGGSPVPQINIHRLVNQNFVLQENSFHP